MGAETEAAEPAATETATADGPDAADGPPRERTYSIEGRSLYRTLGVEPDATEDQVGSHGGVQRC